MSEQVPNRDGIGIDKRIECSASGARQACGSLVIGSSVGPMGVHLPKAGRMSATGESRLKMPSVQSRRHAVAVKSLVSEARSKQASEGSVGFWRRLGRIFAETGIVHDVAALFDTTDDGGRASVRVPSLSNRSSSE